MATTLGSTARAFRMELSNDSGDGSENASAPEEATRVVYATMMLDVRIVDSSGRGWWGGTS